MEATFYGTARVRFQLFKALTHVREMTAEARRTMETLKPGIIFDDDSELTHSEQYWQKMIDDLVNIYETVTKLQQANARESLDALAEASGDEPWK